MLLTFYFILIQKYIYTILLSQFATSIRLGQRVLKMRRQEKMNYSICCRLAVTRKHSSFGLTLKWDHTSPHTHTEHKSSHKSLHFWKYSVFHVCFRSSWRKISQLKRNDHLKHGSDYSLNSNQDISTLDPAQIEKLFQMTGAKHLCQANRYHLLVVIGTMSRLLLMAEPQQHSAAQHGMGVVEVCREENVCGN